ncbi:hypothetical protein [Kitasatospora sp. NPDC058218]|uniref:hypothetical protein n=1 Tax=Kitasatospora sp. NPDC058218 TaxID=3346385 RepID=UPI0036DA3FD4
MARPAARAVPIALALFLLTVGCSAGSPPAAPAPTDGGQAGPASTSQSASPAAAPVRQALEPLTREQLTAVLLPVADLPAGSTAEAVDSTPAPGTAARYEAAAQRRPACAPILTVLSEQPAASARSLYVTGSNVLGNRTLVDVGGFPAGRVWERFDALAAAVHGGCPGFRMESGIGAAELRVEAVPSAELEAPAVGFRALSPTGAVASAGGSTRVYLYVAVGDNRILFSVVDDTAHAPALRADLVTAQIHRLVTAGAPPAAATAPPG